MPIYEYACGGCDREFEVEQRITEDPLRSCPECRSRKVKRLISQTSFVLKGGGWYADLYASKSGKAASDDGANEGAKDASSESKTETKPDSSSEKSTKKESKKKGKKGAKAAAA